MGGGRNCLRTVTYSLFSLLLPFFIQFFILSRRPPFILWDQSASFSSCVYFFSVFLSYLISLFRSFVWRALRITVCELDETRNIRFIMNTRGTGQSCLTQHQNTNILGRDDAWTRRRIEHSVAKTFIIGCFTLPSTLFPGNSLIMIRNLDFKIHVACIVSCLIWSRHSLLRSPKVQQC
jgi:hypothetical protein